MVRHSSGVDSGRFFQYQVAIENEIERVGAIGFNVVIVCHVSLAQTNAATET